MNHNFKAVVLISLFGAIAAYTGLKGYSVAFIGTLFVLMAVVMAYLWNHLVFSKLILKREVSRKEAEFGAPVSMQLSVTNNKLLPLLGLQIEYHISSELELEPPGKLVKIKDSTYNKFRDIFYLNWYEKREHIFELYPYKRGRYEFGTGTISYSDPFGLFFNEQKEVFSKKELVVFPKILPVKGISSLNTYLFGSRPRDGWIYSDPLNKIGTRPYISTDSARKINWKATARHIETQVDVEKPSFDQQVNLILEQPIELEWWTSEVTNISEIAIMTMASLIHSYSEIGYEIKLYTNLVPKLQRKLTASKRVTRGQAQRNYLLRNLALMQNFSTNSLSLVLGREQRKIEPGSTVVIVTTASGELSDDFLKLARNIMLKSRVAIIRVLSDVVHTPWTSGLKEWRIEGGGPWNEMAKLELL